MNRDRLVTRVLKPAVFLAALAPLALLVWDGFHDGLGANPVEAITHRTGKLVLQLLIATLCVTPLRRLTGWPALTRLRRMIGLFAFFYLSLHLATYLVLDAALDPAYILEDVLDRVYITAGFTGFVLLVPLAVTSTNGWVRRLGPARWRALHRLVYAAVLAGGLHYLWLVKADLREPLAYLAAIAVLLALLLPPIAARLRPPRRPWRRRESLGSAA